MVWTARRNISSWKRRRWSKIAKYESAAAILKQLGEEAAKAAKAGLAEGAELVAQDARNRCPVYEGNDKRAVKGALKASIHTEKDKSGSRYKIVADAQAEDGLYYGRIVEFSPKINKPFMYPALEAQKDAVRGKIVEAVREAIRKK